MANIRSISLRIVIGDCAILKLRRDIQRHRSYLWLFRAAAVFTGMLWSINRYSVRTVFELHDEALPDDMLVSDYLQDKRVTRMEKVCKTVMIGFKLGPAARSECDHHLPAELAVTGRNHILGRYSYSLAVLFRPACNLY